MQKALIFNIQRYSLHDGPGIRTLIFFKGCSLRCEWCSNPEGICRAPEIKYNKNLCIGCKKCLACPNHATVLLQNEGFTINRALCKNCGYCVDVCPSAAKSTWGKLMSARDIIKKAERDSVFYDASNGGITLSGGEPVLQWSVALEILKSAKQKKINTAIETAGFYPISHLLELTPYLDTIFFDLKGFDPEIHTALTAGDIKIIKSNLKALDNHISTLSQSIELIVRLPFLPEVNFRMSDMKDLGEFLSEIKNLSHIEIMPFHNLGVTKYEQLGKSYIYKDWKNLKSEDVEAYAHELEKFNLKVKIVTW